MAVVLRATPVGSKFVLDAAALEAIRAALREGGLVVYPTDTVYGLAGDPFQDRAVGRIFAAKERPRALAISMAVADTPDVFRFGAETPLATAFCAKNLPGPYTVVLRATAEAPRALISRDGRIGMRVPDHPIPRLLAKAYGPVTSTSANVHGKPSPTTCDGAIEQLGDRVGVYLDGGPSPGGSESAVVDLTGPRAKVLRPGAVPTGR